MIDQFSRLLEPLDLNLFRERYWTKEHLHLPARQRNRHDSFLRIEDIDVLLQSEQLSAAFLNVVTDGVLHPVEEWSRIRQSARGGDRVVHLDRLLELYGRGATIILNEAHHAIPRLSSLCRQLALEMGFGIQANVYITPPGAKGFPRHKDEHEVFVLQLPERKTWRLFPSESAAPIEIELLAGDLLYIPRGLSHEAVCRDKPSIHVTLGFKPVYAFQLLEELANQARNHPGFQKPVMAGEHFEAEFAQQVKDLLDESTVAGLKERRFRQLAADQIQGWPGRLSDVLNVGGVGLDTVVCAQPGILFAITTSGKSIDVEFVGQKVTVPVFMKPCLDRILAREEFAIRELQGMIADSGKIELVKRFIQTGFLMIVRL